MTADVGLALSGCSQVMHEMFHALDTANYERLVKTFVPDGTLLRQGELLQGRNQIMNAMQKRSTTQRIRHVISNTFIDSQALGLTHLVAYMTAYRFDDGTVHTEPVAISRPFRMSIVHAAMRPVNDSWQFVALTFTPEFDFASDAA